MMYYVNWMLTNAQLELLSADVSLVDYDFNDKNTGRNRKKKGEFDDTKADASEVKEAGDKWIEKYGSGEGAGQGLTIGNILGGGFTVGVGVKTE